MNFAVIMALLNYGLILIYGVLLSIDISGGWTSKKDKHLTAVIIAVLLIAQIVISFIFGTQATEKLYPLITHMRIVLFYEKAYMDFHCVRVYSIPVLPDSKMAEHLSSVYFRLCTAF